MLFVDALGRDYTPDRWLAFNDVLLLPQESPYASRNDPGISIKTHLTDNVNGPLYDLSVPIISANMDTVTDSGMAIAMHRVGGMGILHRFYETKEQYFHHIREACDSHSRVAFSIGCNGSCKYVDDGQWLSFVREVDREIGLKQMVICLDVAHGGMLQAIETVEELREAYGRQECCIIAGNVATGESAVRLAEVGADVIKVGIGCGSICTTRLVTGHGVPQLSAILQIRKELDNAYHSGVGIIADGGIRQSGDIVKALAAGADAVMLGSLLAGTDEAPGRVEQYSDGTKRKLYRGQSSRHFLDSIGKGAVASEGVSIEIHHKGSVKEVVTELVGGIKSGFTYSGVGNIQDLRRKAIFIEITHQGWVESTPHVLSGAFA